MVVPEYEHCQLSLRLSLDESWDSLFTKNGSHRAFLESGSLLPCTHVSQQTLPLSARLLLLLFLATTTTTTHQYRQLIWTILNYSTIA